MDILAMINLTACETRKLKRLISFASSNKNKMSYKAN